MSIWSKSKAVNPPSALCSGSTSCALAASVLTRSTVRFVLSLTLLQFTVASGSSHDLKSLEAGDEWGGQAALGMKEGQLPVSAAVIVALV